MTRHYVYITAVSMRRCTGVFLGLLTLQMEEVTCLRAQVALQTDSSSPVVSSVPP